MGWMRELRSSLENPATPLSFPAEWLLDIFNGGRTDSGIRVSELTALQVSTVYACVDLISSGLASLDLNVYEQLKPRGKRLAWEQDLHWLLHDEPNREMTAYTFVKTLQAHGLLWTNCYSEIERDGANRPLALWPRQPHTTRPVRLLEPTIIRGERVPAATLVYATTDGVTASGNEGRGERFILADDMIHIPGLSLDGRLGKNVIELTRQVYGLALAAEKFGGKFFANGIRPSGVFELPSDMSPQAVDNFKRSVQEAYGGENNLRPLVAEVGIKWNESKITPNEAQFLETRQHQREEIGAIFHVPLRMLGDSGKVNRASSEQEAIEFVQYTLRPWIKAWQAELKRKLFPRVGRAAGKYFPGFYYQDLLTPDAESRGKLISLIKQWGICNSDEIRENFLDLNPIGGKAGQAYWMPVNMIDASGPVPAQEPTAEGKPPAAKPDEEAQRYIRAYSRLFEDAFRRIRSHNKPDLRDFRKVFMPVLTAIAEVVSQAGEADLRMDGTYPTEAVQHFIVEYIAGMQERSADWTEQSAAVELERAIGAICTAARESK